MTRKGGLLEDPLQHGYSNVSSGGGGSSPLRWRAHSTHSQSAKARRSSSWPGASSKPARRSATRAKSAGERLRSSSATARVNSPAYSTVTCRASTTA